MSKDLIAQGIKKKLIALDDEGKYIVYLNENKRRNYSSPEEKVQAETFLKLVFDYKYSPQRVRQFVSVTMGSEVKEADIVVYNDDACTQPHIVVECKKEEVSELEFQQAVIGRWLGFDTRTEVKVASGSVVDTVWESTIGNMGRVIYVFEVQTKGSIDSLIVNLLKALNNPAVQGVVAVSDAAQIAKIKSHASEVPNLSQKLKTWDYLQVLDVYESLESVNQQINALNLVPQSF